MLVTAPLPRRNLTCRAVARDSSNTECRTADATVARQDHRSAEQGLTPQSVPVTGNNGKKKVHFVAASCHTVGRIGIAVTKTDQTPMLLDTEVQNPTTAGLDIRALLREHEGRNYELHHEHVNSVNVRTLKTIGFDRCYTRAEGPYP